MLLRIAIWVAALPLLLSATASTQSHPHGPDTLVARLSYQSTYGIDWREQEGSPRICFALYSSRHYRMMRLSEKGMQTVQGTLSTDQFGTLRTMLRRLRPGANGEGRIIRQGAVSLRAEIVRNGETTEIQWVDPDHEHPFPSSVMEIVQWLQHFSDRDAVRLTLRELSDQPICPPASTKPVQPVVASWPIVPADNCE